MWFLSQDAAQSGRKTASDKTACRQVLRLGVGLAVFVLAALDPETTWACGTQSDCSLLDQRVYRISLPETAPATGAIVFSHGFGGSAAAVMSNEGLRRVAHERGLALVAAQTLGRDWSLPGAPSETIAADELVYFDALRHRLITGYDIPEDGLFAAGFSAGAMMTWTLACNRGDDYQGFVMGSGTFWSPIPETCATPRASVVHVHGRNDTTVPLGGRQVGDAQQGSVPDVFEMVARSGGFGPEVPLAAASDLDCEQRVASSGASLTFCLFDGGHSFSADRLSAALKILGE